ncbi:hypothetical protein C7382_10439 [Porphyromonas loveana]|uniref:Uncharacterized protein n=1 Tax=Porphyromonas loveana TaxID=1884669 RepID=A0A2U1FKU9_9PORP|nr:hypothetical protein C7382_10439 [Porphyromonas loveana]
MCVVSSVCSCVCSCCCICICCCIFIIAVAVILIVFFDRCIKLKMTDLEWNKRLELEKLRSENSRKKGSTSDDKEAGPDKNKTTNEEN